MTQAEMDAAILAARPDQRMEPVTRRERASFRAGMLAAAKVAEDIMAFDMDDPGSTCATAIRAAAEGATDK